MKFFTKDIKQGETRIKRKFLWFPLRIQNEIRWLEMATILQRFDYEFLEDWENEQWL